MNLLDDPRLEDYWKAQAQFGPFDVGPEKYLEFIEKENLEFNM